MTDFTERIASQIASVVDLRVKKICEACPELLEQWEKVTVWEQRVPGNPAAIRYTVTLSGEEIATFSVEYGVLYTHFKITASEPIFVNRRNT